MVIIINWLLIIAFFLALHTPCIFENCIKTKINLNFYLHTHLWCLKRFYDGFKGLHKTFWGTTKKCENKNLTFKFKFHLNLIFHSSPWIGWGRLNKKNHFWMAFLYWSYTTTIKLPSYTTTIKNHNTYTQRPVKYFEHSESKSLQD